MTLCRCGGGGGVGVVIRSPRGQVPLTRDQMQQVPKLCRLVQCRFLLTRMRRGGNSTLVPVSSPVVQLASSDAVLLNVAEPAEPSQRGPSVCPPYASGLPCGGGSRLPPRWKPPGESAGPKAGTQGSTTWNGTCEAAEAPGSRTR